MTKKTANQPADQTMNPDGYSVVMGDGFLGVKGQSRSMMFSYLQIAMTLPELKVYHVIECEGGEVLDSTIAQHWLVANHIADTGQGFYAMDLRNRGMGMVFFCCPACAKAGAKKYGKQYGFAERTSVPKLFGEGLPDQWCKTCDKQILVRGGNDNG